LPEPKRLRGKKKEERGGASGKEKKKKKRESLHVLWISRLQKGAYWGTGGGGEKTLAKERGRKTIFHDWLLQWSGGKGKAGTRGPCPANERQVSSGEKRGKREKYS